MHRSPQKQSAAQRDRYADFDMADTQNDRKSQRGNPPKARKFPLREESVREQRGDKKPSRE